MGISTQTIDLQPQATRDYLVMFFEAFSTRVARFCNHPETPDPEKQLMRNLTMYPQIFRAHLEEGRNPARLMNDFAPYPDGQYRLKNTSYQADPAHYQGSKDSTARFIERMMSQAEFEPTPKAKSGFLDVCTDLSKLTPEQISQRAVRAKLKEITREALLDSAQVFNLSIKGKGHSPRELSRLALQAAAADTAQPSASTVVRGVDFRNKTWRNIPG